MLSTSWMVLVVLPTAVASVRQKHDAHIGSNHTPWDALTPSKDMATNRTSEHHVDNHHPLLESKNIPHVKVAANMLSAMRTNTKSFVEVGACREQPHRLTHCVLKHHTRVVICFGVLLLLCITYIGIVQLREVVAPNRSNALHSAEPLKVAESAGRLMPHITEHQLAGYALYDLNLDSSGAQGQAIVTDKEQAFITDMIKFSNEISDSTRTDKGTGMFIKITPMEDAGLAKILDNNTPQALRRWRYSRLTWWSSMSAYDNKELPVDSLAMYQVIGIAQIDDRPTDVQVEFVHDLLFETPSVSTGATIPRPPNLDLLFRSPVRAIQFCKAMDNLVVAMQEQFGALIIPNPKLADE